MIKENIELKNEDSDELIGNEDIKAIPDTSEEINANIKASSKVILVVDDILYVVRSIANILRNEGYFVITSQTGTDALSKYEKYSPDLVTIDQKLPDMSGTKLVEEIRKIDTGKKTKIIFISALYEKDKIKSILQLGVDNYLLKPFKKNYLIEIISKIFKK